MPRSSSAEKGALPMSITGIDKLNITVETDPAACRRLWEQLMPQEKITDLWEVRECFDKHFNRKPYFILAKERGETVGLLPLSYVEEYDYYGFFPGEVW